MITIDFNRLSPPGPHHRAGYRILDVGCGTGRHACAAYRLEKVTVIAVDLDYKDVSEAADRLRLHDRLGEHGGGSWGLNVADIHRLPFKDGLFDLVICSEVLEHIPDHEAAVLEVVRVLKRGGDLMVSVPRYYPEKICWTLSRAYRNTRGGHVRIYRKRELLHLVEGAGTKIRATHFAHSLHAPFWWLKCLVGLDRDGAAPVKLYHRFLTWDIMKNPGPTRFLDRLLNPVLGKSMVFYFKKGDRLSK